MRIALVEQEESAESFDGRSQRGRCGRASRSEMRVEGNVRKRVQVHGGGGAFHQTAPSGSPTVSSICISEGSKTFSNGLPGHN